MRFMLLNLLLRLSLRLVPLCLALCLVIPTMAGHQPTPGNAWQRFGFTACALPCFAGITPGQTAFAAVTDLLSRNVPTVDPRMIAGGASINFWASWNGQGMSGLARYNQGRVDELRLNVALPVAPVVDQLGTPDCVLSRDDPDSSMVFFWKQGEQWIAAVLSTGDQALDLDADLLVLWLSADKTDNCGLRGALPWHGFAPAWSYQP